MRLLLSVVSLCFLYLPVRAEDDGKVICKVGSVIFSVPRGYQPGCYNPNPSDGLTALRMFALLPDLEPRTPENAAEFDRPDWGRMVIISIESRAGYKAGKPQYDWWKAMVKPDDPETRDGAFTVHMISPGDQALYKSLDGENPSYFECLVPPVKTSLVYHPDCEVVEPLGNQSGDAPLSVNFDFSKEFVHDVSYIDKNIIKFVESLEISP